MSELENADIAKWTCNKRISLLGACATWKRGDDFTKIATGVLAVAASVLSVSAQGADTLAEREVVRVVLRENQTLKAALAKWEMMKARVPQARAWEDLRTGVDWTAERSVNIPPNSFMDQTAMLEQEVPISGKNRSRSRAATAEARSAFEDLRRMELDLIMRARAAYARLANGYAQLEVNRRNGELLNQFVQISRSRYEAGVATQADVLLAQTDSARLLEARADIERQISEEQSALNVLMNRPAQAPLGRPSELVFTPRALSLEELQAMALALRPELRRAQDRIDAEKFRLELANRQWFPDPALNVKAQRYNSAAQAVSEVDVGVSFPVPWLNWKKYSAGVLEARKSVEDAQHEFGATRAEALGLVRDQLKKIRTSANQYELYRDNILPLARQAVEASRAAYEASTGGFLELITARRTLQELTFPLPHLHLADGDTRSVMFETWACGENALHMQHASTGCAGSSWELPDLWNEVDASAQAAVTDRARCGDPIPWQARSTIERRPGSQNQILQIDHDAGRDQSDAAKRQHGNGHGASVRRRGRDECDHCRSSHGAKNGSAHGRCDEGAGTTRHPNRRLDRLQRDRDGRRDHKVSWLD